MKQLIKQLWNMWISGFCVCIVLSFVFSLWRAALHMADDKKWDCPAVGIDVGEPWISTRWFCERK